jgi:nitroimidazol reductase NimA-like FMN-containing flavoprotein (pyridoxamine 5'-phosphate oxidase superfamily)
MAEMITDRNGLEILARDECLRLLATVTIGRVGVTSGALPAVLPVNFCYDDEQVLIRTSHGTKLDAALRDCVVAFEVDDFDPMSHTGWSVMVTGVAHELEGVEHLASQHPPLARWARHGEGHTISIPTDIVSGRRITHDKF